MVSPGQAADDVGIACRNSPDVFRTRPMGRSLLWWCGLVGSACTSEPHADQQPAPAPLEATRSISTAQTASLTAKQRRTVGSGELIGGTHPKDFSRDPALEPLPFKVKLGAFEIDAFPYPNDPMRTPQLVSDVALAEQLCAKADGRLCTELEWERACRGPDNQVFPGVNDTDKQVCADPLKCRSGFDVFALGSQLEWTASKFAQESASQGQRVIRGAAAKDTNPENRRCSRRSAAGDASFEAAFRCCYGAPNAARVTEPPEYPVFERPELDADAMRRLLDTHPRTKALAKDLLRFSDPEASNTVLSRGPGDRKGFSFTTGPLLWSPSIGLRFLLVAGKSGDSTSFVLAYHALANGQYTLASSFLLDNEKGPVVFAYSPSIRPRVHFSTCWGCPGETGKILFRKPDRAVILQP